MSRIVVMALALALVGCGGTGGRTRAPASSSDAAPKLLTAPWQPGEIVAHAEASPRTHGPYALDGTYLARFEQYAPEDPGLDFGVQTTFVASLDRRAGIEDGASVRLFRKAARSGRMRLTLHGRFYLDVSFGDFPYVVRLTPLR